MSSPLHRLPQILQVLPTGNCCHIISKGWNVDILRNHDSIHHHLPFRVPSVRAFLFLRPVDLADTRDRLQGVAVVAAVPFIGLAEARERFVDLFQRKLQELISPLLPVFEVFILGRRVEHVEERQKQVYIGVPRKWRENPTLQNTLLQQSSH